MIAGNTPKRAGDRDESGPGADTQTRALRVNRSLSIPVDELEWLFTTSGGPGGQHANRTSSRAEVRFDVTRSRVLGPRQRARLLERFGRSVSAVSGEHRSQARNREEAMRRLAERLAAGLRTARPRVRTAPSFAARQRRLEEKRRRSELKRQRRPGSVDGD